MSLQPCPESLKTRISQCSKCPLNQAPYNPGLPSIGVGVQYPKILLLGRDPGKEEAKTGRPFVGQAGQLLQPILQDNNISLDDIYVTNIVKHRPPQNNEPPDVVIEACSEYLIEEIDWCKPTMILCLGKTAAHALLMLNKDTQRDPRRGDRFTYKGIPVWVTWHPAYILRNNLKHPELVSDIQEAFAYANAMRGNNG